MHFAFHLQYIFRQLSDKRRKAALHYKSWMPLCTMANAPFVPDWTPVGEEFMNLAKLNACGKCHTTEKRFGRKEVTEPTVQWVP